jgi:A/G-specific adenine glycosylase
MSEISDRLLPWYRQNGRKLPWRDHPDPYTVWVSESMLQQTQVKAVVPYFERWMRLFPTIRALAAASEREVLSAWEGLGYYSRARNLHRAAQIVMERYGGALPADLNSLRTLPGIGRYTAAAIASIAFGLDEATLDGNLRRVFARLYDVTEPAGSPAGERQLWELADQNLPAGQAGAYNQALMDLGATICLPRRPLCLLCPLADLCQSRALGVQESRPVRTPRRAVPTRVFAAAVVTRGGQVLLSRRPSSGLLGGLWEFPSVSVDGEPALEVCPRIEAAYNLRLRPGPALGIVRHAYTHFKVIVHVFACQAELTPPGTTWATKKSLKDYPMGKVDRQIAGWVLADRPASAN